LYPFLLKSNGLKHINPGFNNKIQYFKGLDLAELTTFPEKIIANAREMAARIRKAKERSEI
jgi:DNA mismatch repair ATPase MutS